MSYSKYFKKIPRKMIISNFILVLDNHDVLYILNFNHHRISTSSYYSSHAPNHQNHPSTHSHLILHLITSTEASTV